jgi:hypothetical protein
MSAIAHKIKVGVAASAMAAAATLTPVTVASVAHADEVGVSAVGSLAGKTDPCAEGSEQFCVQGVVAAANTPGSIIRGVFQNELWWIGKANPNPPARSNVFVFTPLSLVPGFLKPAYGWFTKNLNFQACFLGATLTVGPYGTTSFSVGRGCD